MLYSVTYILIFFCEDFSHAIINTRRLFAHNYPPVSIARYEFVQMSELEQRRSNELVQGSTQRHMIRTRVLLMEIPTL